MGRYQKDSSPSPISDVELEKQSKISYLHLSKAEDQLSKAPRESLSSKLLDELANLVHELPYGIGVWEVKDPQDIGKSVLMYTNRQTSIESGYDVTELVGRTMEDAFPDLAGHPVGQAMAVAIATGETRTIEETKYKDDRIPESWNRARIIPVSQYHVSVVYENITVRRRLEERLKRIANEDPVTGIWNRRGFKRRLRDALVRAEKTSQMVGVLFIDLDRFKSINDTYGHDVGDEALRTVAQMLNKLVRNVDQVARIGGDEFAVCLEGINRESDAGAVAKKIIRFFNRQVDIGSGRRADLGCSIGITTAVTAEEDIDMIMKHADTAMYHSKDQGGNCYEFYDFDMDTRTEWPEVEDDY